MRFGVERAAKRGLGNVRFVRCEAKEFVTDCIPPERVSIFHVYFPDPWPKRRHRKRRLVTPTFLALLHDRLQPEGRVELATDDADYFAQMEASVLGCGRKWRQVDVRENERIFEPELRTNYEIKFADAGKTLFYLELVK
jgi:tRNA (guanine-N7-)-methyltransferase